MPKGWTTAPIPTSTSGWKVEDQPAPEGVDVPSIGGGSSSPIHLQTPGTLLSPQGVAMEQGVRPASESLHVNPIKAIPTQGALSIPEGPMRQALTTPTSPPPPEHRAYQAAAGPGGPIQLPDQPPIEDVQTPWTAQKIERPYWDPIFSPMFGRQVTRSEIMRMQAWSQQGWIDHVPGGRVLTDLVNSVVSGATGGIVRTPEDEGLIHMAPYFGQGAVRFLGYGAGMAAQMALPIPGASVVANGAARQMVMGDVWRFGLGTSLGKIATSVFGRVVGPRVLPALAAVATSYGEGFTWQLVTSIAGNYDYAYELASKDPAAFAKWAFNEGNAGGLSFGGFQALHLGVLSPLGNTIRSGYYDRKAARYLVSPILRPDDVSMRGTVREGPQPLLGPDGRPIGPATPGVLVDATGRPFDATQDRAPVQVLGPDGKPATAPRPTGMQEELLQQAGREAPHLERAFGAAATATQDAAIHPTQAGRNGALQQAFVDNDPSITGRNVFIQSARNTKAGGYTPRVVGVTPDSFVLDTGRKISMRFVQRLFQEGDKTLWQDTAAAGQFGGMRLAILPGGAGRADTVVASILASAPGQLTRNEVAHLVLRQYPGLEPQIDTVLDQGYKTYDRMVGKTVNGITGLRRLKELFDSGDSGAAWYDTVSRDLRKYFADGQDLKVFVRFLAALSGNNKVENNLTAAVKAFGQYKRGEPFAAGRYPNTSRPVLEQIVQGVTAGNEDWAKTRRKQLNFVRAMEGDPNAYVHDMWMSRALGFKPVMVKGEPEWKVNDAEYDLAENYVKNSIVPAVRAMTGRPITPRYFQESVWEGIKHEVEGDEFAGQDFATLLGRKPDLARHIRQLTGQTLEMDSPQAIEQAVRGGRWAIISADNPGGPVMLGKNQTSLGLPNHDLLLKELRRMGHTDADVVPLRGHYGGEEESSLFVKGMGHQQAVKLGEKYGQTSVITDDGLINVRTKHMNPRIEGPVLFGPEATRTGNYSTVQTPAGEIHFQIPFDFAHDLMHPAYTPQGQVAERLVKAAEGLAPEAGFLRIRRPQQPPPDPQINRTTLLWTPGEGFQHTDPKNPGARIIDPRDPVQAQATIDRGAMRPGAVSGLAQAGVAAKGETPRYRGTVPAQGGAEPTSIKALAAALGTNSYDLIRLNRGALTAQNVDAAMARVRGSATAAKAAAQKYVGAPSEENLGAFKDALRTHATMQMILSGYGGEEGLRLAEFRRVLQTGEVRGNPPAMPAYVVTDNAGLAKRVAAGDAVSVLADAIKPTTMEMFTEGTVANRLGGPPTWIKKTVGDIYMLVRTPLVKEGAGFASMLDSAITGRERTHFVGSGLHYIFGYMAAFQDATLNGLRALAQEQATPPSSDYVHRPSIPGLAGQIIRAPVRPISAITEFAKELHRRGSLYSDAYAEATRSGAADPQEFIKQFVMSPPKWAQENAERAAKFGTFTNDNKFVDVVNKTRSSTMGGRVVAPFVRVSTNLVGRAVGDSPLGLLTLTQGRPSLAEFHERIGAMALGSLISIGLVNLALQGKVTGAGPSDPGAQKAWRDAGNAPFSMKIHGLNVPLTHAGPPGMVLAAIASLVERLTYRYNPEHDTSAAVMGIVKDLGQNLQDGLFIGGLERLYTGLIAPASSLQHHAAVGGQFVSSLVTPALVRDIAIATNNQLKDPTLVSGGPGQQAYEIFRNELFENIPGLRRDVPARLDRFGNPLPAKDLGAIGAFLPPITVDRPNRILTELAAINRGIPDIPKGFELKDPNTGLKQKFVWGPDGYEAMRKEAGQLYEDALSIVMDRDLWPTYSLAEKREIVDRVVRRIDTVVERRAKAQIIEKGTRAP